MGVITRDLQQAANDLAVVEAVLVALYHSVTDVLFPALPLTPAIKSPKPLRKPGLPRCSAFSSTQGAPCTGPATHPRGLCGAHFYFRYGHKMAFDQRTRISRCKCGASMRWDVMAERRAAGKEFCPLKAEAAS